MKKHATTVILLFIFGLVIGQNISGEKMLKNKMKLNHFINPELPDKYYQSNSFEIPHLRNSGIEESIDSFERFHPDTDNRQSDAFETIPVQDSILLDSVLYYSWDTTINDWVNYNFPWTWEDYHWHKTVFTYDESGSKTLCVGYNWDTLTNDWVVTGKFEYAYDENGKRTLDAFYLWNSITNDWVGVHKDESASDEYGNQTLYAVYYWDALTNDWVGYSKHENTYDENSNRTLDAFYVWNSTSNDWVGDDKYEYSYDEYGNKTLSIRCEWDFATNDWIGDVKYEFCDDEYGNRTLIVFYLWNSTTNDLVRIYKKEYSYDEYGNRTLDVYYRWNSTTNDWVGRWKTEWFYSNHNQSLTPIINYSENANLLKIYPNLITDGVNIELVNTQEPIFIELIDLNGRLVFEKQVSESQFLNFPHLSNGVYLYRVYQDNKIQTGKLIK